MSAAMYIPQAEGRMADLVTIVKDLRRPKGTRESALRELRNLERELGMDSGVGNING